MVFRVFCFRGLLMLGSLDLMPDVLFALLSCDGELPPGGERLPIRLICFSDEALVEEAPEKYLTVGWDTP